MANAFLEKLKEKISEEEDKRVTKVLQKNSNSEEYVALIMGQFEGQLESCKRNLNNFKEFEVKLTSSTFNEEVFTCVARKLGFAIVKYPNQYMDNVRGKYYCLTVPKYDSKVGQKTEVQEKLSEFKKELSKLRKEAADKAIAESKKVLKKLMSGKFTYVMTEDGTCIELYVVSNLVLKTKFEMDIVKNFFNKYELYRESNIFDPKSWKFISYVICRTESKTLDNILNQVEKLEKEAILPLLNNEVAKEFEKLILHEFKNELEKCKANFVKFTKFKITLEEFSERKLFEAVVKKLGFEVVFANRLVNCPIFYSLGVLKYNGKGKMLEAQKILDEHEKELLVLQKEIYEKINLECKNIISKIEAGDYTYEVKDVSKGSNNYGKVLVNINIKTKYRPYSEYEKSIMNSILKEYGLKFGYFQKGSTNLTVKAYLDNL